jgi:hypothetical protein
MSRRHGERSRVIQSRGPRIIHANDGLKKAILKSDLTQVERCLAAGQRADVYYGEYGRTPLHVAATQAALPEATAIDLVILNRILETIPKSTTLKHKDPKSINTQGIHTRDSSGKTALHRIAQGYTCQFLPGNPAPQKIFFDPRKRVHVASLLLQYKADFDAPAMRDKTKTPRSIDEHLSSFNSLANMAKSINKHKKRA